MYTVDKCSRDALVGGKKRLELKPYCLFACDHKTVNAGVLVRVEQTTTKTTKYPVDPTLSARENRKSCIGAGIAQVVD